MGKTGSQVRLIPTPVLESMELAALRLTSGRQIPSALRTPCTHAPRKVRRDVRALIAETTGQIASRVFATRMAATFSRTVLATRTSLGQAHSSKSIPQNQSQ